MVLLVNEEVVAQGALQVIVLREAEATYEDMPGHKHGFLLQRQVWIQPQ